MYRGLRRTKQGLSEEAALAVLRHGDCGVLAVIGDEGHPYAVPLNYVYSDGNVYFHSAREGHKIDAIKAEPRVSFCVVGQSIVRPEKLDTIYRSVIVFGRARVLEDQGEILAALRLLNEKYLPEFPNEGEAEIASDLAHVAVVEISIEHISGKQALELVK